MAVESAHAFTRLRGRSSLTSATVAALSSREPRGPGSRTGAEEQGRAIMDHDSYDEGLVHGHRWATEPTMPRLRATQRLDDPPSAEPIPTAAMVDTGYDEGLVHGHAWAATA